MNPMRSERKAPTGIRVRHGRRCRAVAGGRCNCDPTYEAWVFSVQDDRKIRKTFPTLAAAKGWRADATSAIRRGTLRAPQPTTLRQAASAWIDAADAGKIRSRDRRPYKPSTLRLYRHDLEHYIYPELGGRRLADVNVDDLQALVDRLVAEGLSGSKVRNVLVPLQALYRRHRRQIPVDPTDALDLPDPSTPRDRAASPAEAARLIDALPEDDQALWATAFYAGLRRGELRALRDDDVDLRANVIHVRRSWDEKEGEIAPKSNKGTRDAPLPTVLRRYLLAHRARTGRRGADLFFGRTARTPFTPTTVRRRALAAWKTAKLTPIGLHECRHTYVSLMHTAGVPLERIGDYVGHTSNYMTDRYRHLIEGQRDDDAARLDRLLTGAPTGAQSAESE
jgi:integrase